ncbi:MAG: tetratricopeptide repeat protein [bacterium]|nr:tetratricopeptide repeat protein [bacterium]
MPDNRKIHLALTTLLLLAAALRFYGLDWGTDRTTGEFHRFHPDEVTVIRNTRWVGVNLSRIEAPYGKAPMYLLWAAGKTASLLGVADPFLETDNRSVRRLYLIGRGISAALGTLTVALVFFIGRHLAGPATGLLAAALLAACPGHIQQCHYYTVDGSLAFWVTLSLWFMLHMPSARTSLYIACGIACGLATGTRLAGVWLGVPFLVAQCWSGNTVTTWRIQWRSLLHPHVALYIASAGLVSLACEPFLLLDPTSFFSADKVLQLMGSVRIVTGEHITIWTLYDFSTTPYLFHLTHLLYYAMGGPFQLAGLAGLLLAFWHRERATWVLLAWFLAYFLVVGNLHSKPIRYIVPLLPILAVLGARAIVAAGAWLQPHSRIPVRALLALLICLPTFAYGFAIERIYQKEDARIVAKRWIQTNIPPGKTVLVERGGFPTSWMVPQDHYRTRTDDAIFFINVENCVPYAAQVEFIQAKLSGTDWIALIAENRMQQYLAVPQRYPIGYQYYRRLADETLGFEQVAVFQVTPGIGPWTWQQENVEPTITAFDHPRVLMYRHTDANVDALLSTWLNEVRNNPHLPDPHLRKGVEAYHQQNWDAAEKAFLHTTQLRPNFTLGHLLLREVYLRQNRMDDAKHIWKQAQAPYGRGVPVETRMGMSHVGLKAEAVTYLEHALAVARSRNAEDTTRIAESAARTRFDLGLRAHEQSLFEEAATQYRSAIRLDPDRPTPYVNLGIVLLALKRPGEAALALEQAVHLDPAQAETWQRLGEACKQTGDLNSAQEALLNALAINPKNTQYQTAYVNLGAEFHRTGQLDQAQKIYNEVLEIAPNMEAVWLNLGILYYNEKRFHEALQSFQRATELAPEDWQAHLGLAHSYRMLGHQEKAIATYKRVLKLNPDNPNARTSLSELTETRSQK